MATLYTRLGGLEKIAVIVSELVDLHLVNPVVKNRFAKSDPAQLKHQATMFFCAGSGGPEQYTGKDMLTAHRTMNISEQEFIAVIDDVLAALDRNHVGMQERMEVLAILYSLKGEVVRV
jgi:hemoglobin